MRGVYDVRRRECRRDVGWTLLAARDRESGGRARFAEPEPEPGPEVLRSDILFVRARRTTDSVALGWLGAATYPAPGPAPAPQTGPGPGFSRSAPAVVPTAPRASLFSRKRRP